MPTISMSIRDAKGARSVMRANVASFIGDGDIGNLAIALAEAVDNVILGVVEAVSVTREFDLSGVASLKTTPGVASDVEEGARFIFDTQGGFDTQFRIPTFSELNIVPGTAQVDLTDPEVVALVNLVTNQTAALTGFTDSRNDPIVALVTARESFQRSRAIR